ncbi:Glycosyltransferase involved in cell wall bisynthesis [Sinosporangium album]|uniref:Glycosyltransferase involved in cell wall bisynthesis n=1 Tax=Sinosporangium album TaxID=504805 RepID=A0A1G7W071_9ACTN|nr:glycosyltransferase [Sinosporangium album]SDG65405.1 Glycosyltransferase involved in cell wall bisynthesis [Sinosporangium album]
MHRQIQALLNAGHDITYIAPFTHCNVTPPAGIRAVDVPRAVGSRRTRALRHARSALKRAVGDADMLIVHDAELLRCLPRQRPATVWDVHEHPTPSWFDRWTASRMEQRIHIILSEPTLNERFARRHRVIPDGVVVPAGPPPVPGDRRVVHVGRLSVERGALELIELGRALTSRGLRLDLIGPADPPVRPALRDAQREGVLDWYGHVSHPHAMRMARGSLAGLSLTRDVHPVRRSLPTHIIEYMAGGIPVVATPLPAIDEVLERSGCGLTVPFGDVDAALRAVLDLRADPERRTAMGRAGHAEALRGHRWDPAPLVRRLEGWAAPRPHTAMAAELFA